jgi:hypothetical protein
MWRGVLSGVLLALMLSGCNLGSRSRHSGASGCRSMPRTAPHRTGVTTVPGFHGDTGRLLAVLRQRDLRIRIPARWSATWVNGPSLGPAPPPGTRIARGSAVRLVPAWSPLGSPGVADGSHTMPPVVGLTLQAAVSLIGRDDVAWQVTAPPLSARVTPPDLFDAYCVTSQRPAPGTVITYPKLSTVARLGVAARPTR